MKINNLISLISIVNSFNNNPQNINQVTYENVINTLVETIDSLILPISFNMSLEMLLNLAQTWSGKENVIDELKKLNIGVDKTIKAIKFDNPKLTIIDQNNVILVLNFTLTTNDNKSLSKSLNITQDLFQIKSVVPNKIDLTFDDFSSQINKSNSEQIKEILINNKFLISDDLSKLNVTNFKLDPKTKILKLTYVQYHDDKQNRDVTANLNINLNDTQFLVPSKPTKLDVGSIVGITLSVVSLVVILSCTIAVIVKKKKNINTTNK